jgi:transposase
VIQKRIKELAEEYGMKISTVDESCTSLLRSLCGKKHRDGRIERGLYYCSTYQRYINADVNGAMNVLRKVAATPARASGSGLMAQPSLLRWDGCRWEGRSPMSTREMIIPEARTRIPNMMGIPRIHS